MLFYSISKNNGSKGAKKRIEENCAMGESILSNRCTIRDSQSDVTDSLASEERYEVKVASSMPSD